MRSVYHFDWSRRRRIGDLPFLVLAILTISLMPRLAKAHTHADSPLLLLVSFDGFRWDYLNHHNQANDLVHFEWLKQHGSYADFINSSFSTVTFPNHWTLVTGKRV